MSMFEKRLWVGYLIALVSFLLIIMVSRADDEIRFKPLPDGSCVISGFGLPNAKVIDDCNETFDVSLDVSETIVNQTIIELYDCNYSSIKSYLDNMSLENLTLNQTDYNETLLKLLSSTNDLKSLIDEQLTSQLDSCLESSDEIKQLTEDVGKWKTNASGMQGSVASLNRENERLTEDRQIWMYTAIFLFIVVVLQSAPGASIRRKIFGTK